MRLLPSMRSFPSSMLGLASSLLLLTACSNQPTKPPSDLAKVVLPTREKPLAAMQPIQRPAPPTGISKLPKDQQANAALALYAGAVQAAGKCLDSRDVLITWINGE